MEQRISGAKKAPRGGGADEEYVKPLRQIDVHPETVVVGEIHRVEDRFV